MENKEKDLKTEWFYSYIDNKATHEEDKNKKFNCTYCGNPPLSSRVG